MIDQNIYNKVDFHGTKGLVFLGEKILLMRRDSKTNRFPGMIDLPGGGRESDESPFETFKREVKEEFGLDITQEDIEASKKYQSVVDPTKDMYFIVTKPLNFNESDIIFGNEGLEWLLMTPEEFIARQDGIQRHQEKVKVYITESKKF